MSRVFSGGKRNRDLRARGFDPDQADPLSASAPLPEVKLEDVVISVPSQSRRADFGPIKLFVGGLSTDTTAADLRRWFAPFGDVVDAIVVADRGTGRSRGFGFVSFRNVATAEAATKGMDGVEVDGQTLKVNRAEARPSRY